MRYLDHRLEEANEHAISAEDFRPCDPAACNRKGGENYQGKKHRARRFVDVMLHFVIHVRLAMERHKNETEHVEGRHACGEVTDGPEERVFFVSFSEDEVFAQEACKRENSG